MADEMQTTPPLFSSKKLQNGYQMSYLLAQSIGGKAANKATQDHKIEIYKCEHIQIVNIGVKL